MCNVILFIVFVFAVCLNCLLCPALYEGIIRQKLSKKSIKHGAHRLTDATSLCGDLIKMGVLVWSESPVLKLSPGRFNNMSVFWCIEYKT